MNGSDEDGLKLGDLSIDPSSGPLMHDVEGRDQLQLQADSGNKQPPGTRPRTVAHLDGLRGLAAFCVYMSHHTSWFYSGEDYLQRGWGVDGEKHFTTIPLIRVFFSGGSAAVALFFVLSGYVLSRSPLRVLRDVSRDQCFQNLKGAAIRRPFRLFIPPGAVSLSLALIMHLPFGLTPRMTWPQPLDTVWAEIGKWVVEFVKAMNPFQAHGIFTPWYPYDPPVWTMPVEFKGSFFVFGLVAISSRIKPKYRAILFAILAVILLFTYQWTMSCFCVGVLLAYNDLEDLDEKLFLHRLPQRTKTIIFNTLFFIGWYLLSQPSGVRDPLRSLNTPGWYILTSLVPNVYYKDEYWRFWDTIGGTLLVYGVLRIRWVQKFLSSPPLRHLGRVSFSLYLTHIPFLWVFADRIYRLAGMCRPDFQTWFDNKLLIPDVGPHGLSTRFIVTTAFILPLNLALSEVATRVIDDPSVKISKWIAARVQSSGKDESAVQSYAHRQV